MPLLATPAVKPGTLSCVDQPTLGSAVALRPFDLKDVDDVVRAYQDPDIQRWHVRSLDHAEAEAWITELHDGWTKETCAQWAVVADGALVGRMGLNHLDLTYGVGEIAYWVMPEHRGHGYASAALDILGAWSFQLGLGRLELVHSVHNAGSCGVARRGGYELEGIQRHAGLHADGWHDMHLHALIPS